MQNRSKSVDEDRCCPIGSGRESGQISLLRGGTHTVSVSCCPIEVGKIEEAEAIPEYATNHSKEAGKAVGPLADIVDVSEKKIQQQGRPKLPADGVFGVSEEVTDFEGLLDLFKEGFDRPAATIEIANAGGSPLEVIGQEDHDSFFPINFDQRHNTSESLWILGPGLGANQSNLVVTKDVSSRFTQTFAANMVAEVVLGPGDPEDAPLVQMQKVGKMHVCLVEDGDLSGLQSGAQGHRPCAVVMGSLLNDGKSRKVALQVQTQMHLGGRLASAMPGPVHAVGDQGDSRGIHGMDRPLKSVRQSPVASSRTESRGKLLQMLKHLPEKSLHHVAVAILVGVRKRIAAWGHRSPDHRQFGCVMTQGVADIIEADGMGQLGKKQAHYMTPGRKSARLFIDPVFAGQFLRQMRRDKFTKLMQCVRIVLGRRYVFHTSDSLVGIHRRPLFFNWVRTGLQLHPV